MLLLRRMDIPHSEHFLLQECLIPQGETEWTGSLSNSPKNRGVTHLLTVEYLCLRTE